MKIGAIEAGGTKFVCAIGDETGAIYNKTTIDTRKPEETLEEVYDFFQGSGIDRIGVGSFGPVDVKPESATYGQIQQTPKIDWVGYPLLSELEHHLQVKGIIDTDVNVAALAENKLGAAQQSDNSMYITVGTGIGAGGVINGTTLTGLSHPEMGHITVRRHPDDHYAGSCPYHQDCLEGLASGPAIEARWGQEGRFLEARHEVWEMEAYYLAQAIATYIYILSPQTIVIGGGVMKQQRMYGLIRQEVLRQINGYVSSSKLDPHHVNDYIIPPALGDEAGVKGALLLACQL
ncbi:ROK family protein [Thalassobacillus sp. CUG 92003]|uniref:ROK family protein n=1 Tax=Thalassobacillus sp. CUG 92003 TaxID=2736641 RepID=UPI0015E7CCDF|nr:ROK family protein [Thalassobacillus sp. CUG 92003]